MPLALVALLATAPAAVATSVAHQASSTSKTLPRCNWDKPGDKPFMGDVVAAVDRYQDIPTGVRARLQARMARLAYDEIVSIRRDSISGSAVYRPEIRDMHFGAGRVCASVNRTQWARNAQERGLVYCEASHCILVPTVCRNVSRITRTGSGLDGAVLASGGGGAAPGAAPASLAGAAPGLAEQADSKPAAAGSAPLDAPSDWALAALPAGQISVNTPIADPADSLPVALAGAAAAGGVVGAATAYAGGSVALGQGGWIDAATPAVPAPGSRLLLLGGLLALGGWARRRSGRSKRATQPDPSVQRDLGAHRAGAVRTGGQGDAGATFGADHPLGHGPVSGDLAAGQKRLQ